MPELPDVVILCGGAGLRLRTVTGEGPKAMARVAGRPFLELLLRQLYRNGFRRTILAVGYQKEVIRSYFGEQLFGMRLAYSAESLPLGTGGALRQALALVESDIAVTMNGDSYTNVELPQVVADHRKLRADASVVLVSDNGRNDGGSVRVGMGGKIIQFNEKQGQSSGVYLNAGIYAISRRLLDDIPQGLQISLEQELLPRWIDEGKDLRAFFCPGRCVDIGTPDRYRNAQSVLGLAELPADVTQRETRI